MLAEIQFDLIAILSRVLHTTCAATMLGGLVYMRFVLAPAAGDDPETSLFAGRRAAWAACVGLCTGLLLLSGGYNFYRVLTQYDVEPMPYHALVGVKILLAFAVFALMALLSGKTNAASKLRQNLKLWLNIALACVLAIFLIGAVLREVPKPPKAAAVAWGLAPCVTH